MRIIALPGVYAPRDDTAMLLGTVASAALRPRSSVLELCSGSGAVALGLAARGHRVTAVDVSRRATLSARLNALLNLQRIKAVSGDLLGAVEGARFDVIVSNPPYVPTPPGEATKGASRAWNAGRDGRAVLDRICSAAPAHLSEGGQIFIVQSSLADIDATAAALRRAGLEVEVVARRRLALGPISTARAAFLRAAGHLDDGDVEELAVIRGRSASPAAIRPERFAGRPQFASSAARPLMSRAHRQ